MRARCVLGWPGEQGLRAPCGARALPALPSVVRAFFATRSNSWSSLQAAPALALPVHCVGPAALSPNELGPTSIPLPWDRSCFPVPASLGHSALLVLFLWLL